MPVPASPRKSWCKVIGAERKLLVFHVVTVARPEWSGRAVICWVGARQARRTVAESLLPSFKLVCYHLQRLHILMWLSLLSFSKTEAESGKLCFLFKLLLRFLSVHACDAPFPWPTYLKREGWASSVGTLSRLLLCSLRTLAVVTVKELGPVSPSHSCWLISFRRSTFLLTMLYHQCVLWC